MHKNKVSKFYRPLCWLYYLAVDLNMNHDFRLKLLFLMFNYRNPSFQEFRDVTRGYTRGDCIFKFLLFVIFVLAIAAVLIACAINRTL